MNYPAFFLFGGGTEPGTDLSLGYRTPSQVTMTHDGPRLDAPVTLPLTQFRVYTFRFSQTQGMAVWLNGVTAPAATAAANTAALTEFVQAQIGSSNGAAIDIAEIKAYAEAIDDAQRQWLVDQLLCKYWSFEVSRARLACHRSRLRGTRRWS